MTSTEIGRGADDMHRVKFIHEPVHERLLNWARWCTAGRGSAGSSPMFRHYKAPRYRSMTEEPISIPVDGIDAAQLEKFVTALPAAHRDAIRWFYVFSFQGMGVKKAQQGLGVQRDTLIRLIHDGRSMLKNQLERAETKNVRPFEKSACAALNRKSIITLKLEPALGAPASRREAGVSAERVSRLVPVLN